MADRPERAAVRYAALFDPADNNEWTLPDAVTTARTVHARLMTAINSYPAAPPDPRPALVTAALGADDPGSLDVSPLLDHQRITAERDRRLQVLREALNHAADDLVNSVRDGADTIITDHLAPAGTELWTAITNAVHALDDLDPSNTVALLNAPDRVRLAYLALDDLTAKYNRLSEAWGRLPVEAVQHDDRADHAEFAAGLCTVWPDSKRMVTAPAATPPWPTGDGGKGRLVWLVRAGAVPWWPTPQQRDEAWMTVHKEGYEQMQEQVRRGHAVQGWGKVYT